MIENNIETGMTIAFGIVFLMGFTGFCVWAYVDWRISNLKRDLKRHMRDNYKREY